MTLTGLDVSSYQSSTTLAAWLPKVAFVITKASQGTRIVDRMHAYHVAAARKAGRLVGHYHYAEPGRSSAQAEAAFFLAAAGAKAGEALILDFEPYNQGGRVADYPEWVLAFTAAVRAATGAPCWIYLNGDWGSQLLTAATTAQAAAIRSLPLWKAEYDNTAPAGASLMGWPVWTCWQHTDKPLDLDLFNGDKGTWAHLAIPTGDGTTAVPPSHTTTSQEDIPVDQGTFNTLFIGALRNPYVKAELNADVRNGVASVLNERTPALVASIAKAIPGADPAIIQAAVAAALAGTYDVTLTPEGQ